jgi:hypothetical protein
MTSTGNFDLDSKGTFAITGKTGVKFASSSTSTIINSLKDLKINSDAQVDIHATTASIKASSVLKARVGTNLNLNGNSIKFSTGGSSKPLYLGSNGYMSLGQVSGNARLSVNGGMIVSGTTTAREYVSPSDARLKYEVTPLNVTMDNIKKLRSVQYNWNKLAIESGIVENKTVNEIGLLAQNVEEVYPELINEMKILNNTMSIKTVDYARLNTILIAAFKDNHEYILSLQQRLYNLKKKYLKKLKQKLLRRKEANKKLKD